MIMENKEILAKLEEIVDKKIKNQKIDETTNLTDLGFDSLDKAEIVINIEDEFHIEFNEDEMLQIKTVGDLVKFIQQKTK